MWTKQLLKSRPPLARHQCQPGHGPDAVQGRHARVPAVQVRGPDAQPGRDHQPDEEPQQVQPDHHGGDDRGPRVDHRRPLGPHRLGFDRGQLGVRGDLVGRGVGRDARLEVGGRVRQGGLAERGQDVPLSDAADPGLDADQPGEPEHAERLVQAVAGDARLGGVGGREPRLAAARGDGPEDGFGRGRGGAGSQGRGFGGHRGCGVGAGKFDLVARSHPDHYEISDRDCRSDDRGFPPAARDRCRNPG